MRFSFLASVLLAGLAYGQTGHGVSASSNRTVMEEKTPGSLASPNVGPDDPVITIVGFCADMAPAGAACKTVITRAQFEKLTEALQPGMPLALRLKVANAYARNLRMSAAAEKRGLAKTPAFEEEMLYARMQLLSQDLNRKLLSEANTIGEEEVARYYESHQSDYEQATFARIFIPHARQRETAIAGAGPRPNNSGEEIQNDVGAMTKLAADLRARAVNGEDPDKLQIEAYREAGIDRSVVNTRLEKVRRATLPPQHESAMQLEPGQVSEVFSDPDGAHFIYKMIGKETLTINQAQAEIRTAIASQKYSDSMKNFEGNVVFSDAYFNPPEKKNSAPSSDRKPQTPVAPE